MPFVNIRLYDSPTPGLPAWQEGTHAAIENLYKVRISGEQDERYGEDSLVAHDQWVTLETPHAPMEGEDEVKDRGYAFHRCLRVFNLFLHAAQLITKDVRIRSIMSQDLRPIVIIGALVKGKPWRMISSMYMHPETAAQSTMNQSQPFTEDELNQALYAIMKSKPYLTTASWRSRAQRALRQTGDAVDAIISFQIAAESLLFDTYRTILVDEGLSSTEIDHELSAEIPFKSLLTKKIPSKLGGQWDVKSEQSAVGFYWKNLYIIRNSIIHAGFQPHGGHAEAAQSAYSMLRDHLEARLIEKRKVYPRTVFARLGADALRERGALGAHMLALVEQFKNEPEPFYWPYDTAKR